MSTNLKENQNIIVYENGEIELKVSVEQDTIWLRQKQIAELFDKDVRTINEHIKATCKEELFENLTIRNFRIVQKEGNREVIRDVPHYNLDVIISIGYRTNSKKATKFRQWGTSVLKEYIVNGYVINSEKITHERFKELENDVNTLKTKVSKIDTFIEQNNLQIKQGIFYDGQIFDAYIFVNNLLKSAKNEIIIIDNYIDETVLTIFSKYLNISFIILTKSISKQLKIDIEKYNKQYNNLDVKISNKYHDRFLIIDNVKAYHIGANLKDLAKKVFAFSKIDIELLKEIIDAN
jgi:prophage antirepressor-like protein